MRGHSGASGAWDLARIRVDAKTRWIAEGAESREKRYINVASGSSSCPEMAELLEELKARGASLRQRYRYRARCCWRQREGSAWP